MSFDQLQPDGQRVLLGVLATLTGDASLSPDDINALSQAVRELRKAIPCLSSAGLIFATRLDEFREFFRDVP